VPFADYQQQVIAAQRRRAVAQQLAEMASQNTVDSRMRVAPGGEVVPYTGLEGLANLGEKLGTSWMARRADKKAKAAEDQALKTRDTSLASAVEEYRNAVPDREVGNAAGATIVGNALSTAANPPSNYVQPQPAQPRIPMGQTQATNKLLEELAPREQVAEMLAQRAMKPGFTGKLGPGDVAYDNGRQVASAPMKPPEDFTDWRESGDQLMPVSHRTGAPVPGVSPMRAPTKTQPDKQQLVTRPAPEAGEGRVQDFKVDFGTNQLTPIGKPYVPTAAAGSSSLGGRESVMFQRVVGAGNSAAAALKNIAELPVGTSTGWFGVGASPGTSVLGAVKGVLTNKASPQSVQDYNTVLAGVSRNLSTLETAGLAPNGSLSESMDKTQLREGDTEMTKLRKLAEMRQIIEKNLEPNLTNPRLTPDQKDMVRDIVGQVASAVPYTHHDLTELEKRQNKQPQFTLQQLISEKGLRGNGEATADTQAPSGGGKTVHWNDLAGK
jgi:hypothetical protein